MSGGIQFNDLIKKMIVFGIFEKYKVIFELGLVYLFLWNLDYFC